MDVRVGTYNICHCGDYGNRKDGDPIWVTSINIGATAETIKRLDFDIIGLNEVYFRGRNEDCFNQTEKLASLSGYKYYASAEGASDGVTTIGNALLSKYPIVSVEKVKIPTIPEPEREEEGWYEERVLLVCDIEIDGKIYKVICTHFGCILKERQLIVDAICKILDNDGAFVVMGDFNALPNDAELKPLYQRMQSSASVMKNDDFTFASYDPRITIDYIFADSNVVVKDYCVHKEKTSDHFPVSAVLAV